MPKEDFESAVSACQQLLREEKASYVRKGIWASRTSIIDRLLKPNRDLALAFHEAHEKLHEIPHALNTLFDVVQTVAAFWSPDKLQAARRGRGALKEKIDEIAEAANHLANLLEDYDVLREGASFGAEMHHHIGEVVLEAGLSSPYFQMHLKDEFRKLVTYEAKYWPSIPMFIRELARKAERATPTANDPLTFAATQSSRPSKTDCLKALFVNLHENRMAVGGRLPNNFTLTDASSASLLNAALALPANDMMDGPSVKVARNRFKNRTSMVD